MIQDLAEQFITGIQQTSWLEYVAVMAGIASVWFSRKENILVYPVGLINTIIYAYLSFKYHLIGEAGVNFYYTVMSVYGWILWSKKDVHQQQLPVTFSTRKELKQQLSFFVILYCLLYFLLRYLKEYFYKGAIPWVDALASATAFTGMYLMAKKKVESWCWWIATNLASVPLYFVKGLVVTSVYYLVLLWLAIFGLQEWKQKAGNKMQ
ncbi:MAG: nicotinamide riboside transporter PnuC [Chitinophagaceae bacterium]